MRRRCTCKRGSGMHWANCPALYDTPEKRMERAAHLFGSYESLRARELCDEEGIDDLEREYGAKLARVQRRIREQQNDYGRPEYGARDFSDADRKRWRLMEQDVVEEFLRKELAERPSWPDQAGDWAVDEVYQETGAYFEDCSV